MAISEVDLNEATLNKKSADVRNFSYVEEIDDFTDSGDGFAHSSIFDAREIKKDAWTLYIVPADGSATYKIGGIFELGVDDEPDVDKAIERVAATAVAYPAVDAIAIDEVIPYFRISFDSNLTTSTSVKIIFSVVL